MNEEQQNALRKFEIASAKIAKTPVGLGGRQPESEYAQTYQNLVRMGLRQQLRAKYRM